MKYTYIKPYRRRTACSWLLIGACALIGLAACGPSSNSSSGGEDPDKTPVVTISYVLSGGNDLRVTAALGADASIREDLVVIVTLSPINATATTKMVTLTAATPSGTTDFMDVSTGTYTLAARATGAEINIMGSAMVQIADLEVTWSISGADLVVTAAISSGDTAVNAIPVTITVTPAGGSAITTTLTIAAGSNTGTATFTAPSPATYTLTTSQAEGRTVGIDDAIIEILPLLAISTIQTGTGPAAYSLTIANPARDAWKISLLDTGTAADTPTSVPLTITHPDGTNQGQGSGNSRRLFYNATMSLGVTLPTTPDDFTDGLAYTFLPGDDGADKPDGNYELLWLENDNTTEVAYPSQLAGEITYRVEIGAAAGVSWMMRVELHDIKRLPANIPTTFRPDVAPDATKLSDGEALGVGPYLVYNPTDGESRITLDLIRAAISPSDLWAVGITAARFFVGDQNTCLAALPRGQLLFDDRATHRTTDTVLIAALPVDRPIYCLFTAGSESIESSTQTSIAFVDTGARSDPANPPAGRDSHHFVFTLLSAPTP